MRMNMYALVIQMLEGLVMTLSIFGITLIAAIPLGLAVALLRLSKVKPLSKAIELYIWVMRGTPLLLQLVFVFFGLPYIGIVINRYPAAIVAFILNYGAYFGEIFRGGIEAIDKGQYEGAESLGLSPKRTFFRIILPQVTKRILPAVGNEVITLIKDTSLVYVVGLGELLRVGKIASNREASLIPLVAVGVFYLILTAVLTKSFEAAEKKLSYYQ